MLNVVKFALISSIFAFAVEAKLVMDDINALGNPDYLSIKANIDKSGPDPVVDVVVDLTKDVEDLVVKISLNARLGGEYKEIFPMNDYYPCKDNSEDVFVKYALDLIEKYGNLTMTCPLKVGHYVVEKFRMDADERANSFGSGYFRVDVTANAIENGAEIPALTMKFAFHGE